MSHMLEFLRFWVLSFFFLYITIKIVVIIITIITIIITIIINIIITIITTILDIILSVVNSSYAETGIYHGFLRYSKWKYVFMLPEIDSARQVSSIMYVDNQNYRKHPHTPTHPYTMGMTWVMETLMQI